VHLHHDCQLVNQCFCWPPCPSNTCWCWCIQCVSRLAHPLCTTLSAGETNVSLSWRIHLAPSSCLLAGESNVSVSWCIRRASPLCPSAVPSLLVYVLMLCCLLVLLCVSLAHPSDSQNTTIDTLHLVKLTLSTQLHIDQSYSHHLPL
jgi:hypothetical protein